jgi:UDP-3-O-acyl N-acetylglucosamine deacetylase
MTGDASTSRRQRTLAAPVEVAGVALFHPVETRARILPADADMGFVFVRTDLGAAARVPAHIDNVVPAHHRTALEANGARVETTEHCLAALVGMGIDNAIIEVDAPELPIGDGSCAIFADAIARAGATEQDAPRRELVVREPVIATCAETGARIEAHPLEDGATVTDLRYELDYGAASPIGAHDASFALGRDDFARDLAPARTFSSVDEAQRAREMGLFHHLTPEQMLVIGPDGPVDNALRRPDEPARHKVIDMIGDLALAGVRLRARVVGLRSGHALNHELCRRLVASLT